MKELFIWNVVLVFAAAFLASCSQPVGAPASENKGPLPAASAAAAPSVSPTAAPVALPSANLRPRPLEEHGEAEFNGYHYSYKTDGLKIDAMFDRKPLPQNGGIVVGAIRDIIGRSYGDRVDAVPRIVGSGAAQTIRVQSKDHTYLIVPVKSDAGEINSLIITQLTPQ